MLGICVASSPLHLLFHQETVENLLNVFPPLFDDLSHRRAEAIDESSAMCTFHGRNVPLRMYIDENTEYFSHSGSASHATPAFADAPSQAGQDSYR